MRYKKTDRTRPYSRKPISFGKPRRNKQAVSWHERLDREMMARINREENKYFGRVY